MSARPRGKVELQSFQVPSVPSQAEDPVLKTIIDKISKSGILTLSQSEFKTLNAAHQAQKIDIDTIKDLEKAYKEKADRRAYIKKVVIIIVTVVAVAAVIFCTAYFVAPAWALAFTKYLATGPAMASPLVIAKAKTVLAAGTYFKLGATHAQLSLVYMGVPLVALIGLSCLNDRQIKARREYDDRIIGIFVSISSIEI